MRRVVAHFYLLCMAAVIVSCSGVGKRPNIRAYNCFVRMGLYQEGVERLLAEGGVRRVRHYSFATCLNGNLKRLCSRAKRLEDIAARLRRSDPFGAAEAMMAMAVVYAAAGERERAGSRFKSALTFYSKCLNQRALFHGLFGRLKKAGVLPRPCSVQQLFEAQQICGMEYVPGAFPDRDRQQLSENT